MKDQQHGAAVRPAARVIALTLLCALAMSACGRRIDLERAANTPPPATPTGAPVPPTPEQQVTPGPQAQPARSDEVLKQSDRREDDPFALPPTHR